METNDSSLNTQERRFEPTAVPNRLKKVRKAAKDERLDAFETAVKLALEHFLDIQWLGEYSALAQPYVIGRVLETTPKDDSALERGQALQQLFQNASERLPKQLPGITTDLQRLLRLSFFERNPNWTLRRLAQELNLSEKSYYRHRAEAIRLLAAETHKHIQPPFQTEEILRTSNRWFIGREDTLQSILKQLRPGHPVALVGPSGIGKTMLALETVRRYASDHKHRQTCLFFYTLQAGLTDHLSSLVFALAHCLRQEGADTTWKQLVADHGTIRREVIFGMLRHDLEHMRNRSLVMCIDEVGLLSAERQTHLEIADLLQMVSQFAATLWIGQRLPLPAEESYTLTGLTESDTGDLLICLQLHLASSEISRLWQVTRGNPTLIKLFASLYRIDTHASMSDTLNLLGRTPSTEFVFHRIWSRLKKDERSLLMQISTFQGASPEEAWNDMRETLDRLLALDLVRCVGLGQVEIVAHIALLAYECAPVEIRSALHLKAAHIHEARGNYTLALRHFVNGGQPAYGLWLWHAHRVTEVERGYAALALQSLQEVNPSHLADKRDRVLLGASLSQLYMMSGKPERAEEELRRVESNAGGLSRAFVKQYLGYALEAQNRAEAALESFRQSVEIWTANPMRQVAQIHGERSRLFEQSLGDIHQAQQEALLSRLTSEVFHGIVEEHLGNFDVARQMYDSALEISERVENSMSQRAFVCFAAGNLAWKQNRIPEAIKLLDAAIQLCERMGDSYRPAYGRRNLSAAYIIAGDYPEAIRQIKLGLEIAVPLNHGELISGLTANAGEAHYYSQQYELAEKYALESLRQEEPKQFSYAFTTLGMVRRAQNRLDESIQYLKDAIKTAQDVEDTYAEAAAWRQLGETYAANRQSSNAIAAYTQALTRYKHMKLDKEIGELNELLRNMDSSPGHGG